MTRRVLVFAHVKVPNPEVSPTSYKWEKQQKCEATFHQFGNSYEEFDNGAGNYSTAIVELDDGTIEEVPPSMIKFMDRAQ